MRDILADIVKQTLGLAGQIKIIGTEEVTRIEAYDADKTLLIEGQTHQPVPEFRGEFGVPNVGLLNGLLNFATYRSETARFNVKRRQRGNREIVEEFQFRDGTGVGADYRLMGGDGMKGFTLSSIPFAASIEPDRAKVSEFLQLAQLYNEVEKSFGVRMEGSNLLFELGNDSSSTHRAAMMFSDAVSGSVNTMARWQIGRFKDAMKLAGQKQTISFSSQGILRIGVETEHGSYKYYLLGDQRR